MLSQTEISPVGSGYSRSKYLVGVNVNPATESTNPGHEIPKIETEPKNTENWIRNRIIRFLFGTRFPGTEFTEVLSVLGLGKPKLPNSTELACKQPM